MSARENGWHIKAEGYMTSEPSFQKIMPKKACDAIEFRHVITFMRFENGIVADHRTYVPREFLANERAKNEKLREEAERLRSYEAGYIAMRAIRDKLEAKNKKLLDLVDELWAIAYGYAPDESELDCARDMMRELGVVPE